VRPAHQVVAVDGALVIDKPAGLTSHDVVAAVRRTLATKVGHTGTLDPIATGVLPLLLGRATRLARFIAADIKAYEARVRFGRATDTYDAAGRTVGRETAVTLDRAALETVLGRFRGSGTQQPPAYSAKKIDGRRAYVLARGEAAPVLPAMPVTVHALEVAEVSGADAVLRVISSAGFYVRSLAHDLGVALGCGAHLVALRRTASGPFTLAQAEPLESVLRERAGALRAIVPMQHLLPELPALPLAAAGLARVRHGQAVRPGDLSSAPPAGRVAYARLLAPDGTLAAVAAPASDAAALQPVVVLI
jgi:tRNA pseudouridine55 synthase